MLSILNCIMTILTVDVDEMVNYSVSSAGAKFLGKWHQFPEENPVN